MGSDLVVRNSMVSDRGLGALPALAPAAHVKPADAPAAAFDDAAVSYGGRTIWSHATFSIGLGEFVGLIGPNGTGKTSMLRVLLGQVSVSGGRAFVLGHPPRRGNPAIGYVPQRR